MTWDERLARLRAVDGGMVNVTDWPFVRGRTPYRYAHLKISAPIEVAPPRAAELVAVAIEIDGHVSVLVHGAECYFDITFSRHLTDEECAQYEDRREEQSFEVRDWARACNAAFDAANVTP